MQKDKPKKQLKKVEDKDLAKDKNFAEVIKLMAHTPPISNEAIVKRSKKHQR